MTEKQREDKAWNAVDILGCSYAEAYQMVLDDEAIDHGESMPWDLTPEQKKESRKARSAKRTTSMTKQTRTREPNQDKRDILQKLIAGVQEECTVLNEEREFEFTYNDVKYKVVLSAPRK